jgi:hypothetical protein
MNLTAQDWTVVSGGVIFSLLGGYAAHSGMIATNTVDTVTGLLPKLTMLILVVGVAFVFLSRDLLGGDTARNLEVIASGFFLYALLYYPHKVMWHGHNEPGWLGLAPGAWQTFFHLFTVVTLVIVAYGFYLFWQMGRGGDTL